MGTHYRGTAREVRALNAFIKLLRAAESSSARVHGPLAGEALTVSQFGMLDALYHLGPLPQRELAAKLLKSGGNMTMVVNNLERRGLVRRERSSEDRRSKAVHLTRKGRALFERVFPRHVARIVEAMDVIAPAELEEFGRMCKRVGLRRQG
jgi:MarR family 2-MHQ and catechol resistance regulon transcriptional repressor